MTRTVTDWIEDASVTNAKLNTDVAGAGIGGGAGAALFLDIDSLTEESSADEADSLAIYDDSASAVRKMTRANLLFDVLKSTAIIGDNQIVRGDGGGRNVQGSGVTIADNDDISGIRSLTLDSIGEPSHASGLLFHSSVTDALTFYNSISGTALQIGEEVRVAVRNNSGVTIADFTPVYQTGSVGYRATIAKAKADSDTTCQVIGVTTHSIENNTDGYITVSGVVNGVDTDGSVYGESWVSGDNIYLSQDTAGYLTNIKPNNGCLVLVGSVLEAANSGSFLASVPMKVQEDYVQLIGTRTVSYSGFENQTDSVLTWTDTTPDRTLTIAPDSTDFTIRIRGRKYIKSSSDTAQITDTEGAWFFYYDIDGDLIATQTFSEDIILRDTFVALVYWDATNKKGILVADERHGWSMSGYTHLYLHNTVGMAYRGNSGFELGNISADGSGDSDASAQFSVSTGICYDEDLKVSVTNGTGNGRFEQRLDQSGIAYLPVFYRDGSDSSGIWRRNASTTAFPVIKGTSRLKYNLLSGGVWTQPDVVSDNNYVLAHIFITNNWSEPVIAVMGQSQYSNIAAARDGAETEMADLRLNGLPSAEFLASKTVLYQTSSAYSNQVAGRIRSVNDGLDFIDWIVSKGGGGSAIGLHNSLAGLQGGIAEEYYHMSSAQHTVATQAATSSVNGYATSTQITKLDGVEELADVTDSANVDSAGAVMESDYNEFTMLAADTDNTPTPLTIGAERIVGRKATGGIVALTGAEAAAITGALVASVDDTTVEVNAGTLRVKADGIGSSQIANNAVGKTEIISTIFKTETGISGGSGVDIQINFNNVTEQTTPDNADEVLLSTASGYRVMSRANYLKNHGSSHTDGTDDIQSATNSQKGLATAAQITTLEEAVLESDYNAFTMLAADTDNTPTPLTIGAERIVGRKATGGIVALTGAEAAAITGSLLNVVEDTTPQLGGDLDLNQKSIELDPTPSTDSTGQGLILTVTVTTNTNGFGNAMTLNGTFQWVDADADAATSMPCLGLALDSGTGAGKRILTIGTGVIRNDTWNWSRGWVWISTSAGGLTQTQPSGSGDQVQPIGFAISADSILVIPCQTVIELA